MHYYRKVAFNKKTLITAMGIAGLAYNSGVQANEGTERVSKIEEVTVTATRRVGKIEDIPYSISALGSDSLERTGITDFTKLARNVPGLTFVESGARDSGINSGLIIRGLNASPAATNDFPSLVVPTVSTYLGETPLFANIHLKDIERVEILRGPQGTLYGSGSLGGTIRYIPKKPDTDAFYAEVGSKISSTRESGGLSSDTYGVINLPISHNLALRTVIGYVDNQGFIDATRLIALDSNSQPILADPGDFANSPPVEYSKSDTNGDTIKHIRASLLWDVNESVNAQFSYHYQENDAEGRQVQGNDSDDYEHVNRLLEPLERELEIASLEIEADLGFAVLSSSTSYYRNEAEIFGDSSGPYLNAGFWYSYGYDGSPRELVVIESETEDKSFIQEIRLASNSDGVFDWLVGLYYQDQDFLSVAEEYAPGLYAFQGVSIPTRVDQTYFQPIDTVFEDKAIFGEITWHLTDRFQMTFGARYFEQEYTNSRLISLPYCGAFCSDDFTNPLGISTAELTLDFEDEIFKFNTSYDLTDDILLYATWAEGFRRGGANGVPTSDTSPNAPFAEDPALGGYDADNATNWELGIKGNAWENRMRFTVAAFYIDWDDIQIDAVGPISATSISLNGGTAQSQGLELEIAVSFTDNFQAVLGYGYTDAELKDDFNIGGVIGRDGDELPNVPKHSANISISYIQSVFDGAELIYHLNGSYLDEVQTALNPSNGDFAEVASSSNWDASISYSTEQWVVGLFINNLTNEHALSNTRGAGTYTSPLNPESGRDLYSYVNRPRTIGLNFSYKFL